MGNEEMKTTGSDMFDFIGFLAKGTSEIRTL
jgi:hypothetical protein